MAMNGEKLTVRLGVALTNAEVSAYAKELKSQGYEVTKDKLAGTIKATVPQDGKAQAGRVIMRGFEHRRGLWHVSGDPAVFTPKEEPSNG